MTVNGRPFSRTGRPTIDGIAREPRLPVIVRQDDHRSIAARAAFVRLNQTSSAGWTPSTEK